MAVDRTYVAVLGPEAKRLEPLLSLVPSRIPRDREKETQRKSQCKQLAISSLFMVSIARRNEPAN